MSDTVMGAWIFIVIAVLINGCAGGVAAVLHRRRASIRWGGRIATAATVTGLIATSMLLPVATGEPQWAESGGPLILVLALAAILAMAPLICLPGAVFVARRLEGPGDEFRVFE